MRWFSTLVVGALLFCLPGLAQGRSVTACVKRLAPYLRTENVFNVDMPLSVTDPRNPCDPNYIPLGVPLPATRDFRVSPDLQHFSIKVPEALSCLMGIWFNPVSDTINTGICVIQVQVSKDGGSTWKAASPFSEDLKINEANRVIFDLLEIVPGWCYRLVLVSSTSPVKFKSGEKGLCLAVR